MDVESAAFDGGIIAEKYGSKGQDKGEAGAPSLSFPLRITGAPPGTASYAIVFDDPDSVANCGFRWVHWLALIKKPMLEEDASRNDDAIIQGVNSWYGNGTDDKAKACFYGGPSPPDGTHQYVLTVLALDFEPALKNGFTYDSLKLVSKGHILAKASIKGMYSPAD